MQGLMRFIAWLMLVSTTAADEPADSRVAIERGLDFLAQDARAWRQEHNCVSCHHAGLVVWSMHEARQRGFTVDEPLLKELAQWMTEAADGKTSLPRPEDRPKALNTKAVYFALALRADPQPAPTIQDSLQRFRKTIRDDQLEDGSWSAWPETRPPMFGPSDDSMSALAALALQAAVPGRYDASSKAVQRGTDWLMKTKPDRELQSMALRLVLFRRLNRPDEECRPLVELILKRQKPDGGWSQVPDLSSDAWATGQALYALAHADIKAGHPAVEQARAFLIRTQREDGSWLMTSRPSKPGDKGAGTLIPITGAGSAWAVLGLLRSH